ncbi:hypothetical protein [Orenia marismortui]|uniref:hypothetical protein n=1 Tax=Orenia marismortui TaxID=46469 RepID=UPI000360CBE4|nr:hypothetical protein [Orenia marismortui]
MNLITPGVIQNLVSADSFAKLSDVSMGVYYKAKAKGDKAAMEQAAGYAVDSMNSANKCSKHTQKALKEAQQKAKKQAKAEQEEAIEKHRQETSKNEKTIKEKKITDTVEISKEGQEYIDSKDHAKSVQKTENKAHKAIKNTVSQEQYTSEAKSDSLSADSKFSITA